VEGDLATRAASVGALADPARRALYDYVAGESGSVSREEAATQLASRCIRPSSISTDSSRGACSKLSSVDCQVAKVRGLFPSPTFAW
jgi:hypothetical protein